MAAGITARQALAQAWWRELIFLRDSRWDLMFITVLPIVSVLLMVWMFQGAVVRQTPVAIVDEDRSALSRELIRTLSASPGVHIVTQPVGMAEARHQIRTLDVFGVVRIPAGTERRILRGQTSEVYAFYNATYMPTGQAVSREIGDAVTAFNSTLLQGQIAAIAGPDTIHGPPVSVQARMLFNPARSFQLFLVPMIASSVLSLCMALSVTAAFGRELRAGVATEWPGPHPVAASIGRILPYLLMFWFQQLVVQVYIASTAANGVAGSTLMLWVSIPFFMLACSSFGLLFLGLIRDAGLGISFVGMMIGTALAYSGATFPVDGGSLFTRSWSAMSPLTWWLKLQNQQMLMESTFWDSLLPLGVLMLITSLGAPIGLWCLYGELKTFPKSESTAKESP